MFLVEGIRMPVAFNEDRVKEALSYKPRPGDVFVVTYPKCGTTWVQYIVWCLFNLDRIQAGQGVPTMNDMLSKEVPFLEWVGTGPVANLPEPRLMKHHLPFSKSPYHAEAKYVVVARNPFDCIVSFYHMRKRLYRTKDLSSEYTFDSFFESFMTGDVPYDSYFDHVLSWYEHRHDPNVHVVYYEVLLEDTSNEILKVADFLDPANAARRLRSDPDLLQKVKDSTSFNRLRSMAVEEARTMENYDKDKVLEPGTLNTFFRKGIVGDWRNHLSPQQEKRLKEVYDARLGTTEMHKVWSRYLGF